MANMGQFSFNGNSIRGLAIDLLIESDSYRIREKSMLIIAKEINFGRDFKCIHTLLCVSSECSGQ